MSDGKPTKIARDYKILVSNLGISRFGTSAFNLVIIWVILNITYNNAFLAGLGDGLLSLPLFMSFIVGAFIDSSMHKKLLGYAASIVRSLFLVSVLAGIYLKNPLLTLISIYASAFMIGFTSDILNSLRASWTKQFLDERNYKAGSSLSNSASYLAEGIGYASSGIFLMLGDLRSFYALIIVFVVSIVPLFLIHPREINEKKKTLDSIREGFKFINKTRSLKQIMFIGLITNLVFGMAGIIFIALVKIRFGLPAYYVSMIFLLFIVGMIIGAGIAPRFKGRLGRLSILPFFLTGAAILVIPFLGTIFYDIIPVIVVGLMIGTINVFIGSAFLHIIPAEMMARVNGAFSTFALGATFSSGMIGGLIIQLTSVSTSFLVIGCSILAVSPLWFMFRELYSLVI